MIKASFSFVVLHFPQLSVKIILTCKLSNSYAWVPGQMHPLDNKNCLKTKKIKVHTYFFDNITFFAVYEQAVAMYFHIFFGSIFCAHLAILSIKWP